MVKSIYPEDLFIYLFNVQRQVSSTIPKLSSIISEHHLENKKTVTADNMTGNTQTIAES